MIFLAPPDPPESSSPNAAKDGASVALTELNIGTGIGIGASSCDGRACSDSTVVFSFAGGAITSLAGAGAAADPGAGVKAELGFLAVRDAAAIFATSFLIPSFLLVSLLITSFLTRSFLITPGEAGCRTSTAGAAVNDRLRGTGPITGLNPAESVQVVPAPWPGGAAVSLLAELEPVLAVLLLEKQTEHAGPRQPTC